MNDWWLKFERAEKHMVDIKDEVARYTSSNPYSFTTVRLPDSKNTIRGRFKITEQPDPMISVMLGDFIHNLRCALDYVVVACVPKKCRSNASFPIVYENIFAKDESGNFVVNNSNRINFESAIKGIHSKARTLIIEAQPYHISEPSDAILGMISRLENADKHRELITVGCGGTDCSLSIIIPSISETPILQEQLKATPEPFLKDNAVISFSFPPGISTKVSDMEIHLSTTANILIQVIRVGGNKPPLNVLINEFMDIASAEVRKILTSLEFFVVS